MSRVPFETDREWLDTAVYPRLIRVESGCWEWSGAKRMRGYGVVARRGRNLSVHRVVYEDYRGPIPDGLQIDHLCGNQSCANPDHLEAVTPQVNSLRYVARPESKKTHCKHGHPFDEANTWWRQGKWRVCRTCQRERKHKTREAVE